MKDRIKKIRVDNKLSMEKFGKRIGITKASVSRIESGENNPSEQTIILICQEFNINPDWLRTGKGSPTIKRTRNQEIQAFANNVMELPDASLKKRLIEGLAKLNEADWEKILEIAKKLLTEN